MGRPSQDGAGTHVLEAIIIATIMVSAAAFVATFEAPPPATTASRPLLQQQAKDALSILLDTPVHGSSHGDNMLSVYLAECMQGDCSNLTRKLDRLMPEGSSYALYVSNGYETFPIVVTRSPPGEAVSARRLLEPHWSYTFTSTGMSTVNNWSDPLVAYALPVFNSNVVAPSGSPLKVTVEGKKRADSSRYTLQAFYTTLAVDEAHAAQHPAVSLNFLTNKTLFEQGPAQLPSFVPGAFWDRTRETISLYDTTDPETGEPDVQGTGEPTLASLTYTLRLDEDANVPVPAGTRLTVNVPRGWNATGWGNDTWEILENATDWNASSRGSDVVARLKVPVAKSSVTFAFNATYRGDALNDYPFRAVLSHGAEAEASLLVKADAWPPETLTYAYPGVRASVPRPMGSDATTTWSLVVDVPYEPASTAYVSKRGLGSFGVVEPRVNARAPPVKDPAATTPGILIQRITIEEESGAPIFGSVTPGVVHQGAWASYGSRLVWTGSHLTTQGPLNLTFEVEGSGKAGLQAPKPALAPPVTFDGHEGRLVDQLSPGLYRSAILPNNTTGAQYSLAWKGYASEPTNPVTAKMHDFSSDSVYKSTTLAGRSSYAMSPISPFHDGIFGSYVGVEERSVPIGGQVVVTADVQSILYTLSQVGQSAGVNLTFYPPWTGDEHVPIWWQDNLESGVVASDMNEIVMLDVNDDGYPDPVVGSNQGRVFALHALTGERLQGNVWIAPVLRSSQSASVSAVTALETLRHAGEDYLVVGTDAQSNVFVLDKDLQTAWSWEKSTSVTSIDASTDFDGDGEADIVVAFTDNTVSVLRVPANDDELEALAPANPSGQAGAYYAATGTAGLVRTLAHVERDGDAAFALSVFNNPGAHVGVRVSASNGLQPSTQPPQIVTSVPRAGLDTVDNDSDVVWQFLAGPVNVQRAFDGDGDATTDLLVGTSSGYVALLNGTRGSSPVTGGLLVPAQAVVDADMHDLAHGAIATDDGGVYFTRDGWNVIWCVNCDPTGSQSIGDARINGVALNSSSTLWAVGDAGAVWRSTTESVAHQPQMAPTTLNGKKGLVPFDPATLGVRLLDVHFRYGDAGDEGWIVGDAPASLCSLELDLLIGCSESMVLRTQDGGETWDVYSAEDERLVGSGGGLVTQPLRRINFTTDDLGWIVGDGGTLLRTNDSGASFHQIASPTTDDLTGISCVAGPDVECLLSTETGRLYKGTNVDDAPAWADLTPALAGAPATRILDVALARDVGYLALPDGVFGSWDDGAHWSRLPQSYVRVNFTRLNLFPDGSGFVWGGNDTTAFSGYLVSYERRSVAQTVNLLPPEGSPDALPAGAVVVGINVTMTSSSSANGRVELHVTGDGGAHWQAADDPVAQPRVETENGVTVVLPSDVRAGYIPDAAHRGRDARLRFVLANPNDAPHAGSLVSGQVTADVVYRLAGSPENQTKTVVVDLWTDARLDAASTTAVWNAEAGQLRQPLVSKGWTANVSGEVLDLRSGFDLDGDGRQEVWAGTGNTLAENSPEYQLYSLPLDGFVRWDNRVYLLDGASGAILASSGQLDGPVEHVQVIDKDGGGPDYVFAVTWDPTDLPLGYGTLYALDPATLAILDKPDGSDWTYSLGPAQANDMEIGLVGPAQGAAFVAMRATTSATSPLSGELRAVDGASARLAWRSIADDRGHYVVQKEIPRSWFYGPYVVEVRVEWEDTVTATDEEGVPHSETILQAARFYDYFLVTPPDSLSPPSPVYDVHLVAWFDDWR